MKFTFTPMTIPEVILVEHERHGDARGSFAELFREDAFREAGLPPFVQENLSRSQKDVIRGLHLQRPPMAIAKLVRCSRGRILDVAVDLRRASPTFKAHVAVELDEEGSRMLFVPIGFAHGFAVLSDFAEVQYKTSGYYSPAHEVTIRFDDPAISVPWPVLTPIVSARDAKAPRLAELGEAPF